MPSLMTIAMAVIVLVLLESYLRGKQIEKMHQLVNQRFDRVDDSLAAISRETARIDYVAETIGKVNRTVNPPLPPELIEIAQALRESDGGA